MPNPIANSPSAKRPKREKGDSSAETTLRYITMLEFIPWYPEGKTVEQIMQMLERQDFDVSARSVQRDLHKLKDRFNLVNEEEDKKLRWSFNPDKPPRMFPSMDDHTALGFRVVHEYLKPLLPPSTLGTMNLWFGMAAERLSSREGIAARWQEKIFVHPTGLPRQPPRIDPEVQQELYETILYEEPVKILYLARGKTKPKEHFISPLGLVVRNQLIYLVATMNEGGSILQFALHRIRSVEPIDGKFLRPKGFNLRAFVEENFGFPIPGSRILKLKLRLDEMAAISVAECPLTKKQILQPQPEGTGFLLTADVPNTLELRQWIRSMGSCAEVLEPGFLRAEFAEEMSALAQRYGTSPEA